MLDYRFVSPILYTDECVSTFKEMILDQVDV